MFICANLIAFVVLAVATVYSYRLTGDISEAANVGDVDVLLHLVILVTIVTVIRGIFSALSELYINRFSASAGYSLRQTFIKHFLHAPFSFVEESGTGESLSILSNDAPAAERLAASVALEMVRDLIGFLAAFAFLLFISPFYTAVSFGASIVLIIFIIIIFQPIQNLAKRISEKEAGFNAVVNDSLQNISTIAAYSLHKVMEDKFMEAFDAYFKATKRFIIVMVINIFVGFMAMMGPLVVIFIILGIAVINNNMYLTDFIAFSLTLTTLGAASLMNFAQNIGRFKENAGRAKRYLENTSHIHEKTEGVPIPKDARAIVFNDVYLSYKEDLPFALDGVSFEIKPGSKAALVGGSGSGKSTVLKLILGLYEPTKGEVSFGGENITKFGKKELRDSFSYVPQDSFLFPESIRKNITLEDKPSDVNRLNKACTEAGILEFINSLPGTFDSELAELAENISGGQRQRIAMARAFYKNADIILFDEATSSLDPKTESEVLGNLLDAAKEKTVVMVAHRAMSIAACDTIIVMDKGKICQIGTHEELIKSSPVYQKLYAEVEVAV